MISKEEVKHIAKLARLGLTEKESGKFQKELSKILDYIGKLKEADVSKVMPTSHPFLAENVMRKDEGVKRTEAEGRKLLELAPDKKEGYLKVKSIFK